MPLQWTTVLLDRSGAGPPEQDVSGLTSLDAADWHAAAENGGDRSSLPLRFPATEAWNIREGQEWWAGWRDPASRAWSPTDPAGQPDPPLGGYVFVSTGGADGPLHTFSLNLSGYDLDLDTTDIIFWPDPDHYDRAYPDGYSAADWLVGLQADGLPYDGLIPARLGGDGGYLRDGIDPVFGALIFGLSTGIKPGYALREAPLNGGFWGFVPLRDAITDVVYATLGINGELDPIVYVEAGIDPADATRLRPRLRVVDRGAVDADPVAVFASDAGAGEWQICQPFTHVRGPIDQARQRVVVTGDGPGTTGPPYAIAYRADRAQAGTVYQTDPGRAGKPYYSPDITDAALAAQIAAEMEAYLWGYPGQLRFRVRRPTLPGEVVAVRIPQEGIARTFRVAAARRVPGVVPWYDITIGTPPRDMDAWLTRRAQYLRALRLFPGLGAALPLGQAGMPGAARRVPVTSTPGHTGENAIMARTDRTVGLVHRPGYVPPGATPSATPADQVQHTNAAGAVTAWFSNDGRPHPNAIHLGGFVADGTGLPGTFAVYALRITAVDVEGGPGAVTLRKNGASVAGPLTAGHHVLSPAVAYAPRVGSTPADVLSFDVSGTSSTPTYIVVWEA